MMSRDVVDDRRTSVQLVHRAGDYNPSADLASAASHRERIETVECRNVLCLTGLKFVEEPAVQRLVDPAGSRSTWIV